MVIGWYLNFYFVVTLE